MKLYAHPFSSFCQKALIALYENDTPFAFELLEGEAAFAELTALWPVRKFPVLQDGERTVVEATGIIEHLAVHHLGPVRLIPADPADAVEVRMMDRVFDHYVSSPQQKLVADALRPEGDRDPYGVAEAKRMLATAYAWLDERLAGREWATDHGFSLADCAAAPALFYADWSHPIDDRFATLKAYRARLLARPSMARAVDEARPYRSYFPLGAPDRD
ncbi:MAG: glutathione S-transferase family protein [Candidatus Brevundimonas phytovorans]|nr:glutathione S-transferase family protein [Brevundimonas sp.]WEK58931.1 MAG: glutathione S-transferase family protein [Brevundimonas sp.]